MHAVEMCLAIEMLSATPDERLAAAFRMAETSLMNGSATETEKQAALEDASRAGVTTSEYLYARLLLQASMRTLVQS
jgi:hypothetical protein